MGRGNKDARCFRRPKPKRADPMRCGCGGRVLVSKETCPPELPSDRDDSDARCVGGARAVVPSAKSRASDSSSGRCWLVEKRSPSCSSRLFLLFFEPSGPVRFLSIDLRRMPPGCRSTLAGSKERRRRVNCCRRPRFLAAGVSFLGSCSGSIKVGGVVIMAGAAGALYVSAKHNISQDPITYARCYALLRWQAQGAPAARSGRRALWPSSTAASPRHGGTSASRSGAGSWDEVSRAGSG